MPAMLPLLRSRDAPDLGIGHQSVVRGRRRLFLRVTGFDWEYTNLAPRPPPARGGQAADAGARVSDRSLRSADDVGRGFSSGILLEDAMLETLKVLLEHSPLLRLLLRAGQRFMSRFGLREGTKH